MKNIRTTMSAIGLVLSIAACEGPSAGSSSYNCNNLPPDSIVMQNQPGGGACDVALQSGLITQYVISEVSGQTSAIKVCNVNSQSQVPTDQANFDATNPFLMAGDQSGFTFASNNDFLKTDSCASGSVTGKHTSAAAENVQTYIWITQP